MDEKKGISFFRNEMLYGGLTSEEYQEILPGMREENRIFLRNSSGIAVAIFLCLAIANIFTEHHFNGNLAAYLITAVIAAGIHFCTRSICIKDPGTIRPLIVVFKVTLYLFAIWISLLHPDYPSVTIIALLMVLPTLFISRPITLVMTTTLVAVVAIVMSFCLKSPEVARFDTWNLISLGCVSIAVSTYMMRQKFSKLMGSLQLDHMSRTDLLTGVENRNSYEKRIEKYPEECDEGLLCVYADVNGLHALNNDRGHKAGDNMLITVAAGLRKIFGKHNTFRVGGDEFIAFKPDSTVEETERELAVLLKEMEKINYHVSCGIAYAECDEMDIEELVRAAEVKMYESKREFYQRAGNDRRSRRSTDRRQREEK